MSSHDLDVLPYKRKRCRSTYFCQTVLHGISPASPDLLPMCQGRSSWGRSHGSPCPHQQGADTQRLPRPPWKPPTPHACDGHKAAAGMSLAAAARSDCCRRACCSQMENVQHGGKQQCFASHSTYGRQGIKRFTGNHLCRNCRCAEFVCVLCIQQPHNINDAQSGFAGGPTCCCCCCLCPVGLHTTQAASCCMMQVQPAPT